MIWRAEIKDKEGVFDSPGEGTLKDIHDLGISSVSGVRVAQVYTIEGDLAEDAIRRVCEDLLTDQITQESSYHRAGDAVSSLFPQPGVRVMEIAYNPGVMDPVETSTLKGIRDLGIKGARSVRTSKKYFLQGQVSEADAQRIADKVLMNKLIQHVVQEESAEAGLPTQAAGSEVKVVLVDMARAGDKQLKDLSQKGQLFLNLEEMKAIRNYFRRIGRNPTDCELETVAQTWSEHCHHKTFRGNILYRSRENGRVKKTLIRSLLKSTIIKATRQINKSWCVSVFHDNAGVIDFDKEWNVCFKVETHNHPSALEPFGGANTGVGGVIRDTLGTGLGAKPVCNTDIFCFAPPDYDAGRVPAGTLHPKRVMKGVVSGVRDYGNKMGIPTINGAILFDDHFVANPLVYCGNVGLIPKGKEKKAARTGDLVVVAGGRTGRDGIHGATFSSGELTHESEVVSSGAVQIGNPIEEKKVLDALMQARDENLYSAITDCGAGGLSSAVGEMGQELGARVQLEAVPLKYKGLSYTEIWISESQERMVMAVPPKNIGRLLKIFEGENAEATVIGEFTGNKRLELFFGDVQVCDLDMEFLHEGIPQITKQAVWAKPKVKEPKFACPPDLTESLLDSLSHYNVCSKEWVIRQYDHEVQGGSVVKPLCGAACDGPSDASVITPRLGSVKGVAISNGINIRYGMIDPFWMAASCIDEAVRQVISVGGDLSRIAILDNFCWGNPDKPDRLGSLVRAAQGCYKAAVGYGVPFISGKDSLYNEYTEGKKSIAIPGTILISAIGIIEDVTKCVTMDFKKSGNLIYAVGKTMPEMGGSIYYDTMSFLGGSVPQVNFKSGVKIFQALSRAVRKGLVRSAHDCSEGGLGVALAEMAFSGGLGVTVRLDQAPSSGTKRNDEILFSESNTRFLAEVAPEHQKAFERTMAGVACRMIGRVESTPEFIVHGLNREVCVNAHIGDLKDAWQKPLSW
ncbi:MAG: phosphoribosylformylglycinamidine synthase subunit PurL [Candidatus Omnitrophota bacterium]|nr:phosphoribosylformylglycinamidine synthase subunit PurL [Candidatus Omnitrophota bacterium]MDZ4241917.1 phosphoribosylformylglycinamidine synthase subunit PurL [Candidatus Omnitrophota bacterium]